MVEMGSNEKAFLLYQFLHIAYMCLSDFRPTDISRINTGPLTPPRATTYGKQVIRFRVNLDETSWACGQPS